MYDVVQGVFFIASDLIFIFILRQQMGFSFWGRDPRECGWPACGEPRQLWALFINVRKDPKHELLPDGEDDVPHHSLVSELPVVDGYLRGGEMTPQGQLSTIELF